MYTIIPKICILNLVIHVLWRILFSSFFLHNNVTPFQTLSCSLLHSKIHTSNWVLELQVRWYSLLASHNFIYARSKKTGKVWNYPSHEWRQVDEVDVGSWGTKQYALTNHTNVRSQNYVVTEHSNLGDVTTLPMPTSQPSDILHVVNDSRPSLLLATLPLSCPFILGRCGSISLIVHTLLGTRLTSCALKINGSV